MDDRRRVGIDCLGDHEVRVCVRPDHHPLRRADRIPQLDHRTRRQG